MSFVLKHGGEERRLYAYDVPVSHSILLPMRQYLGYLPGLMQVVRYLRKKKIVIVEIIFRNILVLTNSQYFAHALHCLRM